MPTIPLILALALLQDAAPVADRSPQNATATIRGRITDKETGRPLARAVVILGGRGRPRQLAASTNDEGRYEFTGLEPGEYQGFVEAGVYRASHAGQPIIDPSNRRRMITVAAGQVRDDVDVALPRSFAITVRVVDEWGGPLSGLWVKVMDLGFGGSHRGSLARTTDDLGRLRVYGLSPGSYRICAEPQGLVSSGSSTDSRRERFLRTCYPSALEERESTPVSLEAADISDLEIRMRRGRTFSISGVVVHGSGAPAPQSMVGLNRFEANGSSTSFVAVGADGRFTINNVVPGDYAITAELGGPNRPEQKRAHETAYCPIRVNDADIEGLVITTTKTLDVHGRVTIEDAGAPMPKPEGSGLMIRARLADDPLPGSGSGRTAIMDANRQFVLEGMFGRRVLDLANVPRGWYVKSIRYRGKEIIDTPVEFTRDDGTTTLEVVLSSRGASVRGRVLDERGNPLGRARVLMFRAGEDLNRFDPFVRVLASRTGEFRIGPARPGEYLIAALPPDAPDLHPRDRDRLAALMDAAERITLGAEEERTLDVNVIRP